MIFESGKLFLNPSKNYNLELLRKIPLKSFAKNFLSKH